MAPKRTRGILMHPPGRHNASAESSPWNVTMPLFSYGKTLEAVIPSERAPARAFPPR